ncbi:hypothetical protein Golob_019278, partial [Gossypium lobatum]|nr:hypothetical protein [Gossypium lobatum]
MLRRSLQVFQGAKRTTISELMARIVATFLRSAGQLRFTQRLAVGLPWITCLVAVRS